MRLHYYILLITSVLFLCCKKSVPKIKEIAIIPKPLEINLKQNHFLFDSNTSLKFDKSFEDVAFYFKSIVKNELGIELKNKNLAPFISFKTDSLIQNDEAYELIIEPTKISILAKTERGIFYGIQSLLQLVPNDLAKGDHFFLPCLEIKDQPKFPYRGMHLDVGRHLYSVAFIKKYIDLMSRLKLNTFHWHLTEDQGWRIEIKKYPKLQEISAFRKETLQGHYNEQPHQFDGKTYGGYYTQEEIKDIVKYAKQRQITIIPEIEMPGHSQAAIAAYPDLGCTGKPVEVATKWGVFDEVYCTKESTFKFLEDVIDEVIQLFPGKYIHIGGDEAPKTKWKNCNHCQKLIKKENLKDEHGLQSYFISRMETYINSKGKQIIGWDEILEGGLAPNATVMSWRGTKGAVEAAKQKHNVILTPTSHCYFDYYQSDNENEPIAIGGFLPLEKVYEFNPIPKELTKEESKYVLGAQGNVWTEYMPTSKQVEYMAFPRMIALSEVIWSNHKNKDYTNFINRLEHFNKKLDQLNVNYANHLYEIKSVLKQINGQFVMQLNTTSKTFPIYFSVDKKEPSILYTKPISIDSSMTLKAVVKESENKNLGAVFKQKINLHKGVSAKITINKEPHPSYNAGGKIALINGISGNNNRFGDKEWLGFWGDDLEINIEFDELTEINSISTRFYNGNGQWIYAPKKVLFYFDDSKHPFEIKLEKSQDLLVNAAMISKQIQIKKIKLVIPNYGIIPNGKQGAGNKSWTFIDEIIIE